MRIKRGIFGLLRLSVAFGILFYIFSKIPVSDVVAAIKSAKINYIIAAIIISILSQWILAHRLRLLTDSQGMSLSTSRILETNFSSVFYGLFLPGGNLAAGTVRIFRLSKPGRKYSEAFISVLFDRMAATVALCVTGVLFWLIESPLHTGYTGLGMILALGLSSTPFMLLFGKRTFPPLRNGFDYMQWPFVSKRVNTLFSSLKRYQSLSLTSIATIFSLSILGQLLGILVYYLLAMSLGMSISFITIGWVRAAVLIVSMIPVSVSGLGMREAVSLFLLKPYGISGEDVLGFSFLVFAATLLLIGAVGGLLEGKRQLLPGG